MLRDQTSTPWIPSLKTTSWAFASPQTERIRPATYPPIRNAAIVTMRTHAVETVAAHAPKDCDGYGETSESPMAAPALKRTNDRAAARIAPAKTAPHST